MHFPKQTGLTLIGLSCLALTACDHNDSEPSPEPQDTNYTYEISIQNLTQGQPLSPVAIALHDEMTMWQVGDAASPALELLAEGGDNSDFLGNDSLWASVSGEAVIAPGDNANLMITVLNESMSFLTVATMLVNTNDAFTGITGYSLGMLEVSDSVSMMLPVWDAGTEINDEAAGTIPGPADGGEGFNTEREGLDAVSYHAGVISVDDGLPASVLSSVHRFDNPGIKLTITRIE